MTETTDQLIIGIDLGTTNSAVGVVDSGFPILLADEGGSRLTRSAVFLPGDGKDPLVGDLALRSGEVGGGALITSIKRLMGARYDDAVSPSSPYSVEKAEGGGAQIRAGDRLFAPEEIAEKIVERLVEVAEAAIGRRPTHAVVTVPAYFNDGQRNATKRAVEGTGLTVARIINEPTAAALAYGIERLGDRSKIAVYDLGGGTFDLSVLELDDGLFRVLSTHGDTRLGGDDIDEALGRWIWGQIGGAESYESLPQDRRRRLLEEACRTKIVLSGSPSTIVRMPFLDGGKSREVEVKREDFDRIIKPVLDRSEACCHRALADSGLEVGELDAVLLVGGSTRIPAVRDRVAKIFGREPDTGQHPDEAVALGAVVQAGILSGAMRKMVLLDVTPLSLGIETFGGLMNVIIPRNTTIPAKAGELFTNPADGQEAMRIRVLQGERELANDNWELGQFDVSFPKVRKGAARVGVQFRIDEDGILEVLARDTSTGEDTVLEIRDAAVNVGDAAVEEMVRESVEHAFDDFEARRFAEQKIKADELLLSLESAMAAVGSKVDAGVVEALDKASARVKRALESDDASALREANDTLDDASAPLVDLLLEAAFEQSGQ